MSNTTLPAAVGARLEPGVGPLAQRVESLMQELAEHDPLLKLAMDPRAADREVRMNSIEWALMQARAGSRVARAGWEPGVWLEWSGEFFLLCRGTADGGFFKAPYAAGAEDLRASDWDFAK